MPDISTLEYALKINQHDLSLVSGNMSRDAQIDSSKVTVGQTARPVLMVQPAGYDMTAETSSVFEKYQLQKSLELLNNYLYSDVSSQQLNMQDSINNLNEALRNLSIPASSITLDINRSKQEFIRSAQGILDTASKSISGIEEVNSQFHSSLQDQCNQINIYLKELYKINDYIVSIPDNNPVALASAIAQQTFIMQSIAEFTNVKFAMQGNHQVHVYLRSGSTLLNSNHYSRLSYEQPVNASENYDDPQINVNTISASSNNNTDSNNTDSNNNYALSAFEFGGSIGGIATTITKTLSQMKDNITSARDAVIDTINKKFAQTCNSGQNTLSSSNRSLGVMDALEMSGSIRYQVFDNDHKLPETGLVTDGGYSYSSVQVPSLVQKFNLEKQTAKDMIDELSVLQKFYSADRVIVTHNDSLSDGNYPIILSQVGLVYKKDENENEKLSLMAGTGDQECTVQLSGLELTDANGNVTYADLPPRSAIVQANTAELCLDSYLQALNPAEQYTINAKLLITDQNNQVYYADLRVKGSQAPGVVRFDPNAGNHQYIALEANVLDESNAIDFNVGFGGIGSITATTSTDGDRLESINFSGSGSTLYIDDTNSSNKEGLRFNQLLGFNDIFITDSNNNWSVVDDANKVGINVPVNSQPKATKIFAGTGANASGEIVIVPAVGVNFNVDNGDTITISGEKFTFVGVKTGLIPNEVEIGLTLDESIDNLVYAINNTQLKEYLTANNRGLHQIGFTSKHSGWSYKRNLLLSWNLNNSNLTINGNVPANNGVDQEFLLNGDSAERGMDIAKQTLGWIDTVQWINSIYTASQPSFNQIGTSVYNIYEEYELARQIQESVQNINIKDLGALVTEGQMITMLSQTLAAMIKIIQDGERNIQSILIK
ncbi:MAG: hypothetical protein AB8B67_04890 [Rickettsiaceae bacterium]